MPGDWLLFSEAPVSMKNGTGASEAFYLPSIIKGLHMKAAIKIPQRKKFPLGD